MSKKRGKDHINAQKSGKIRDNNVCQVCGSTDHVEGHHILDFRYGGAGCADNIIALCRSCHKEVHRGKLDISLF